MREVHLSCVLKAHVTHFVIAHISQAYWYAGTLVRKERHGFLHCQNPAELQLHVLN